MTWKQLNSRSVIVTLLQKWEEHKKENRELLEETEQSKQHKAERL